MSRVLYTKYSTERRPELQIRTSILEDESGRYILKTPMTEMAKEHVSDIRVICNELSVLYKDNQNIRINNCKQDEDNVRLEYVSGNTLEKILDEKLMCQDHLGIIDMIKEYKKRFIDDIEHSEFIPSGEFRNIFGDITINKTLKSISVSDIDLIFSNIIIDEEGRWNVIDYEWTYDFSMPVNFILYRALCDYLFRTNKRDCLWHLELLKLFGIDEEEQRLYQEMDRAFHKYVNGDMCSLAVLSQNVNKTKYIVNDLLVTYIPGQVQVFYDHGEGYSENHSEFVNCMQGEDGSYTLKVDNLKDVKNLRIDPSNQYCVIDIVSFDSRNVDGDVKQSMYYNNGQLIGENLYVYNTDDPQWVIPNMEGDIEGVVIKYFISNITKEMAAVWTDKGAAMYKTSESLTKSHAERDAQFAVIQQRVKDLEHINRANKELIDRLQSDVKGMNAEIESLNNQNLEKLQEIQRRGQIISDQKQHDDNEIAELKRLCQERMDVIDNLRGEIEAKNNEINVIKSSTSWKVTKPVRAVVDIIKK